MNIRVKSYLSRGEAAEQAQEPQGAEEPEEGKGGGGGDSSRRSVSAVQVMQLQAPKLVPLKIGRLPHHSWYVSTGT